MTAEMQRLECLGWRTVSEGRQKNCWFIHATSCRHSIIAIADTQFEAWSAMFSMAMKLTAGDLSLPRL